MHERCEEEPAASALFFPSGRSPELNSRVADLCRRCFLPGVSYHYPLVTLAPFYVPVPAQTAGVVGVLLCEAPRDSPWKFSVFLPVTPAMQPICQRRMRTECASTKREEIGKIFVEDTQLRGESDPSDKRSAKNKNSFILRVLRFCDS